jgi:hypothetical protein
MWLGEECSELNVASIACFVPGEAKGQWRTLYQVDGRRKHGALASTAGARTLSWSPDEAWGTIHQEYAGIRLLAAMTSGAVR